MSTEKTTEDREDIELKAAHDTSALVQILLKYADYDCSMPLKTMIFMNFCKALLLECNEPGDSIQNIDKWVDFMKRD